MMARINPLTAVCVWLGIVIVVASAGAVAHQTIELMPRSEWNVQESDYSMWESYKAKEFSPEESLKEIFSQMAREEMQRIMEAEREKTLPKRDVDDDDDLDDDLWVEEDDDDDYLPVRPPTPKIEHYDVDDFDFSEYKPKVMTKDTLVSAVMMAFNNHHPIVFSPDLVYGYLAKGIATHINKYPEELRKLFVTHEGKEKLTYRNDSFIRGADDNDWADMYQTFADLLKGKTNGSSVVQNDLVFSTSSPLTQAHRNLLSMESMKSYFDYECITMCGISCVILEGELGDWLMLRDVIVAQLKEINDYAASHPPAAEATLSWWSPAVQLMLDNFVDTFAAQQNDGDIPEHLKIWWSTIYKYNAAYESGGVSTVTGWINTFYPYLRDLRQTHVLNPWLVKTSSALTREPQAYYKKLNSFFVEYKERPYGFGPLEQPDAVDPDDFPSYISSVPFTWMYHGEEMKMNVLIGYSVLGQMVQEGAQYPVGTLKMFPASVIHYV